MKVFDGRYSWDGKRHDNKEPITWFPGAYNLKIFDISGNSSQIQHIKPYLCIYSETGEGMSISENPVKFAQHICDDFSLEFEKVLWVEEVTENSGDFEVVTFNRSGKLAQDYFYQVQKRSPLKGERKVIETELATLKSKRVLH